MNENDKLKVEKVEREYVIKFNLRKFIIPIKPLMEITSIFSIICLLGSFLFSNYGLLFVAGFLLGMFFSLFIVKDETGRHLWETDVFYEIINDGEHND